MSDERPPTAQPTSHALESLRGLAKAHSDQQISRRDYIHKRRDLIDNIVSGVAEIVAYESEIVRPPPELEETTIDGEATLELSFEDVQKAKSASAPRPWGKVAVVAAILLAFAGIGWFIAMRSPANSVGNNDLVRERISRSLVATNQTDNSTPVARDHNRALGNAVKFLIIQS